jgi:PAS domain-containing protein
VSSTAASGRQPGVGPHLRWLWRAYLFLGVGSMVAFHLVPDAGTQHTLYIGLFALSVVVVLAGVAAHGPGRRLAWYGVAFALGLSTAGSVAYAYRDLVGGAEAAFGHLPDLLYSLAYVPFLAAVLTWARQARGRMRGAPHDIGLTIAAVSVSAWLMVWPAVGAGDLFDTTAVVLTWRFLAAVVVLGVAAILAMTTARITPALWAVLAMLCIRVVSDLAWIVTSLEGTYTMPSSLDTAWQLFPLLAGVAALHPSMRAVGDPALAAAKPVPHRQMLCLAAAVLLLPATVVLQGLRGIPIHATALGVGAFVIAAGCLMRLAHVIDAVRRATHHANGLLVELAAANGALTASEQHAQATATATEQTLRRYDLALRAGTMALWDWNIPEGTIVRSQHATTLFDLPAESVSDLMPLLRRIHPDDREVASSAFLAAEATRQPFEIEYRLLLDSGQARWIRDIGRPSASPAGHMHGVMLDVTSTRMAADALEEREALSRSILDSLPAATVVLDADGAIIATNAGWEQDVCEGTGEPWRRGENYLRRWEERPGLLAHDRDMVVSGVRAVIERAQRVRPRVPDLAR